LSYFIFSNTETLPLGRYIDIVSGINELETSNSMLPSGTKEAQSDLMMEDTQPKIDPSIFTTSEQYSTLNYRCDRHPWVLYGSQSYLPLIRKLQHNQDCYLKFKQISDYLDYLRSKA
jgi:hypothetical protein